MPLNFAGFFFKEITYFTYSVPLLRITLGILRVQYDILGI